MNTVFAIQDVTDALGSLRDDPLLFVLITLLVACIVAMSGVIVYLFKHNKTLTDINTSLAKGSTEAVTSLMPIITYMQEQLKEARIEQKGIYRDFEIKVEKLANELKEHIGLLMQIGKK